MPSDILRSLVQPSLGTDSLSRRAAFQLLNVVTLAACSLLFATQAAHAQDEFVGPFASWANAKTQYGAMGDGTTDDTAALQRALNDLGTPSHSSVLFLPAGTYRITATLIMTSQIWVSLLGADPSTVTIRWDGPVGGTMLLANGVRYSRWGRITWDGHGRALTAVHHRWDGVVPGGATGNEHADEVFKGVAFGLRAGDPATNLMDAEMMVIRCKFIGCSQAGVSIESWNALDWFIWHSDFQNCNIGVTNQFGAGNFHVYYSNFVNSTVADVTIQSTLFFSLRGNFSRGSRKFYSALGSGQNSAQVTLENNTILDTQDPVSVSVWDLGPLMLFDNIIRSLTSGPPVQQLLQTGVENISMGNSFTVPNPILVYNNSVTRAWSLDDQIVPPTQIVASTPVLPGTPPNLNRVVFDVPAGSPASVIQQMVNFAAALNGQKPVVHLPFGNYQINQSVVIPAQSDVQIVGDGQGTRLYWSGIETGPILHLIGPSQATLREFAVEGQGVADGIVIDNADQLGARIFGQQLYVPGSLQFNILADHLNSTVIEMRGLLHIGAGVNSIKVIGGDQPGTGRVDIFGGASSSNSPNTVVYDVTNGGRLLVQDTWYEGKTPRLARLVDRGIFTLHGGRVAPSPQSIPVVEINGFHGMVTLAGVQLNNSVLAANAQSDTSILLLGIEGTQANYVSVDPTVTNFALLNSHAYTVGTGSYSGWGLGSFPIPNQGTASPNFLRSMLASTRTEKPDALAPLPAGVTDVKLYRLAIEQSGTGLHVKSNVSQCSYSVTTSPTSFPASGNSGTLNIATANSCPWTAASNANWVTFSSATIGTGNGALGYVVAPNLSTAPRSASLSIGSQSVAISQAGACAYSLSSTASSLSAVSTGGIVNLSTATGCAWTAASDSSWLTVTPTFGTGSATLTYSVSANSASTARTGNLLIASQGFIVTQAGNAPVWRTVSFQQGVNGYSGAQDRSITNIYAQYNNGQGITDVNGSGLDIRNTQAQKQYQSRALLRFGGLSLPTGATVTSAQLIITLTNWSASPGALTGYYLLSPWNATSTSTVNWLWRDTGVPWAALGASGVGTDIIAQKAFQISGFTTNGDRTLTIDLDPAIVQNWVNSAPSNQGVIITNPVSGWIVTGYSSRSSTTALRPSLTITYQ
jgi:hypothetical protein